MSAEAQRRVGEILTPAFLTRALRTEPNADASLGPSGAVIGLAIEPCGKRGKTGSHLLRVVPEYAQLPAATVDRGDGGCATPAPPSSLLVKVAARRLDPGGSSRNSWMAEQDAREVSFYREHSHRIRLPVQYYAHTQWPMDGGDLAGKAQSCVSLIVMEDLGFTHHSGEDAVAPLFYGCGPASAQEMSIVALREMARLHAGTWVGVVGATDEFGQREADFMVSTCFRVGAGHDLRKAARLVRPSCNKHAALYEALLLRQLRTGSMLQVEWSDPHAVLSGTDRATFMLALAQAAPNLCSSSRSTNVASMLRVVEERRGCGNTATTWSPAAAAVWSRMRTQHTALCHGDFHPGNLMFPQSSAWSNPSGDCSTKDDAHLAQLAEALRVIDFQHWGLAPVPFELLYFILHCLSIWGIERDQIPWLVQTYVDALATSASGAGPDLPVASLSVEALMEEMLAILVECYASFLADDCFDCREPLADPLAGSRSPGLQTLTVRAVLNTDAAALPDSGVETTGAGCVTEATASVGMVRVKWSFSSDASARSCSEALTRAAQLDSLLDLGADLLYASWGAKDSELGMSIATAGV